MTTETEPPSINIRDLSKFPRPVARVVAEAVNKHGAKVRMMSDGVHLRLMNGNREVLPCKVAASRPPEHTMRYLIPWLEQNIPSWTQGEVSKEAMEALRETVTSEPKERKAEMKTTDKADVKPITTKTPEPEQKFMAVEVPKDLVCRWPDCGRKAKTPSGYRMHWAGHTGEKKKHAKKGAETARLNRDQSKVVAMQALSALAEMHGLTIGEGGGVKRIKELEAQVKALTKERDDALARVALLNEAFKGLD